MNLKKRIESDRKSRHGGETVLLQNLKKRIESPKLLDPQAAEHEIRISKRELKDDFVEEVYRGVWNLKNLKKRIESYLSPPKLPLKLTSFESQKEN